MKNILRLWAIVLAFAAFNVHARGVPIVDHEAVPAVTGSGKPASAEQIRLALQIAGAPRGWQITPSGPGKAFAVLMVRKHTVTVDVSYTSGQYSIKYRDSTNMDYDPERKLIHGNYNKWVQTLMTDTRVQLLQKP